MARTHQVALITALACAFATFIIAAGGATQAVASHGAASLPVWGAQSSALAVPAVSPAFGYGVQRSAASGGGLRGDVAVGSSCANPSHISFSSADLARGHTTNDGAFGTLRKGAVVFDWRWTSGGHDHTQDLMMTYSAAVAGVRICQARGVTTAGASWSAPGSVRTEPDRARGRVGGETWFASGRPGRLTVFYAKKSRADGASCANPYTRYHYFESTNEWLGDSAVRLRVSGNGHYIDSNGQRQPGHEWSWSAEPGYRLCQFVYIGANGTEHTSTTPGSLVTPYDDFSPTLMGAITIYATARRAR